MINISPLLHNISCRMQKAVAPWLRYCNVNQSKQKLSKFFSHLGFWSGNLFLIAPFPDLCLLVPYYTVQIDIESGFKCVDF